MITSEDINKIIEAQKEIFYTREELDVKFDAMNENFSDLQTTVSNAMEDKKSKDEEILVINNRIKNAEDWIDDASPKLGMKFEH